MDSARALILAKVETVAGTDALPTAALNAILVEGFTIEPVWKKVDRKQQQAFLSAPQRWIIGQGYKIKFKTELKGSGVVATPPEIGPLFRACNYTEVISGSTSVAYHPNSSKFDSETLTIYFWKHNRLHKATACRGNFTDSRKAGEISYIEWEFSGVYSGPVDAPLQVGTYNATNPALFASAQFTINSWAGVIENIKFVAGNDVAQRSSANAPTGIDQYFVKGRAPTCEIDPEDPEALAVGAINVLKAVPTAAGTGYALGDVLTITTGGTGATAKVTSISGGGGTGPVTGVELVTRGSGYTTGTGKATTVSPAGGTSCTLEITSVYAAGDAQDFWTAVTNQTQMAMTARSGTVAGNICTTTAPKAQLDDVKYGERENTQIVTLPLTLYPTSAGNDELVYTFT